jgi:hypothetical protein
MRDHEKEFLLAEYEQAWSMILNIDERRFKFVEYYSAIFAGVVAVAANFAIGQPMITEATAAVVTVLFVMAVAIGGSFLAMMRSERRANVRYRKKVNLIRGLMLGETADPAIREYLTHKDLGIKLFTDPEQPGGIGSTLRSVVVFLGLEIGVLVAGIVAVWAAFFLSR